ncbi:cytoplasmic protein [Achromobacter xylosoxidans]
MLKHRIVIHRHGELLGHFDASARMTRQAVMEIQALFKATDGFRCELRVEAGERRILESGPDGIRVLGSDTLFTPVATG